MTDAIFSEAELGEIFDESERKVADWRRAYGWPHVRIGRTVRYTQAQVEQILAKHSREAAAPTAVALAGQTKRSARRSA